MKYLKGLDTLRALAATIVVVDHIEIIKQNHHISNLIDHPSLIYPDGHLSVILFFVISGFLITYLLLIEENKTGTINLKSFYLRRILRIWPLYYLILFLSYVIFNPDYSLIRILLPLFIAPNISYAICETWDVSPQIWSIGVEEQFYMVWPLILILISKSKRIFSYIILLTLLFTLLPFGLKFINLFFVKNTDFGIFISRFFYGTKFNCMGIGVLLGFIYFKRNEIKFPAVLKNRLVIYFLTALPFVLWFFKYHTGHLNDELYAVLFAFSIYQIVHHSKINIDLPITRFLGKISYGIYLFHWIIIILLIEYIPRIDNEYIYNAALYSCVFLLTISVSWISFVTYERFFLNLKKKYEINKS